MEHQEHTYVEIDTDGTAECTICGLRNSDPTKEKREHLLAQIQELSNTFEMELKWSKIYTADVLELERVLGMINRVYKSRNN
jgi:hypothetical protein